MRIDLQFKDMAVHNRARLAFAVVHRVDFLPPESAADAAQDCPLPIGFGQTNSQPTTVRIMVQLLDAQRGEHVLDVGSGSGWTTALLAQLVGPTGSVTAVEIVPELVDASRRNLARYEFPWARVELGARGRLGVPDSAPYQRILVSAEAAEVQPALVDQLAAPGRMVAPVAHQLAVVDRSSTGAVSERRVGHFAFVPLR